MTAISLLSPSRMSIDGEYIEDHVAGYSSLKVSGRASLEYAITDADRSSGIDGMDYYSKRQQGRTLTITFALFASSQPELTTRFRALKNFVKGENRELRFADEPNKHYIGTLKTIELPDEGKLRQSDLAMTFYCADPYLTSDIVKTETASSVDGILTATVANEGSGEVYPVYEITHTAENGYISKVQDDGTLELGAVEEADGSTYTHSEELATLSDLAGAAADTGTNRMRSAYNTGGTLISDQPSGTTSVVLRLSSVGTGSSSLWRGGMKTFTLPADSEGAIGSVNFYSYFNIWFETGLMGQTAEFTIAFLDASNNVIAGYSIRKSDKSGNTAYIEFWGNGKLLKSIKFTPSYKDSENPLNCIHGDEDLNKEGEKLTFYFAGKYYEFNDSAIAESACTKVQVSFSQAPGPTTGDKYVSRCYLRRFYIKKSNVEKWQDNPNRYAAGSQITVDVASDTVELNGLVKNDEVVTGSVFAPIQPGETDINFYKSSWCTTDPTVQVKYYERWL